MALDLGERYRFWRTRRRLSRLLKEFEEVEQGLHPAGPEERVGYCDRLLDLAVAAGEMAQRRMPDHLGRYHQLIERIAYHRHLILHPVPETKGNHSEEALRVAATLRVCEEAEQLLDDPDLERKVAEAGEMPVELKEILSAYRSGEFDQERTRIEIDALRFGITQEFRDAMRRRVRERPWAMEILKRRGRSL